MDDTHSGASHLIARSADVLGGRPVFTGTRVPVRTLLDFLEAGPPLDEFLTDYTTVSREQVAHGRLPLGDAALCILRCAPR
jgi:uncharacterized protein (DUF433 family)